MTLLSYGVALLLGTLAAVGLFFFSATRGALLVRGALGRLRGEDAHVYPLYSDMRLIRLVDCQPIIAAILLFQYSRLVSIITQGMQHIDLHGRRVLITSCAFGNVMPRVVRAAAQAGASKVLVADIIQNELDHAMRKLADYREYIEPMRDNAVSMRLQDGSVSANVMFFLLHELPHAYKEDVVREAIRVLAPGGKLFLAEFHRPGPWLLRALSWVYFKVFEPYGLALWDTHDPVTLLEAMPGVTCERHLAFFGNFQVIVATKE
ncbi:methyltransferase domain-containing protein [Candidatus Symbiobacter mobilis]|uniref:UbiE methyltransferase n=1 Tax=Candidatus Symbiobacter mobilis CR TaxID=946483 RepID=U5N6L1_9BURK|nr:methyltransferase domain-containing protein [Candidatus Symbiobacter mobilis]AGX87181.1 UbiE methyltransferase [Candidatus Symbiobacter mobilis CR]